MNKRQNNSARASALFKSSLSVALISAFAILTVSVRAAELEASDGAPGDAFGVSLSLLGNTGLIGASNHNSQQGSTYLFRNVDTATGIVTESVKLQASDGAALDRFGESATLSGTSGLVGAYLDDIAGIDQGSAYLFRNLDTASGTVTQNAKLQASDGGTNDNFGYSSSLSGNIALVGSRRATVSGHFEQGSAYLFRNLDTASGTVTQNAKLQASDGATGDRFGYGVSISGTNGVVSAELDDIGANIDQGSAYLFRNLDTALGAVTQNAKLQASDGAGGDNFGDFVSLAGNNVLIGAFAANIGSNTGQGAAYLFRNLDTAAGIVTQNAKLQAFDGASGDHFGVAVSLSGADGLVGAYLAKIGGNNQQGAVYLFSNLDTASGAITETVKVYASDGTAAGHFGTSTTLDGDGFIIGSSNEKAYSGAVSSVTTLDAGNVSLTIDGISFISRIDWIIGHTTSANQVTLMSGNSANVTATGKGVYIGQQAGSNNNTLLVQGSLTANQIYLGAIGNIGNTLLLGGPGNRIADTTGITLNNGVFSTTGLSETVGMLTAMGNSVIDLGSGNSILHFADSSSLSASWSGILNVYNWTGSLMGGGMDQLYFGNSANGLTSSQLAQIDFYAGSGTGFLGSAQILSTGEVIPLSPSPTPTPTPTATAIATATATATATFTPTPTAIATATATFAPTPTATFTPTPEPTATYTPTPTATATFTSTPTATAAATATATSTSTPAPTATPTSTIPPTSTATPTAMPSCDRIAFASTPNGNREIYIMDRDGSNRVRLTNNTADDFHPSLSRDGSKIAFASDLNGGNYAIYVMNADGSNLTQVTFNSPSGDFLPSFSADGSKIAFESTRDGDYEVYIMNTDGSNQTRLTHSPHFDDSPSFSPDGNKIVFSSFRDGNYEVYVMNSDGSNQTQLTNNSTTDSDPVFSPDGTKIAFTSSRDNGDPEIYLMNADGSNQTRLTTSPGNDHEPSFSADGSKIAFSSNRDGNYEIYVMDIDGSNQTRLTTNGVSDDDPSFGGCSTPIPTPTPTATATFTLTPTPTATATATFTPTSTATATTTATATATSTPTATATAMDTPTPTATATSTATPTPTPCLWTITGFYQPVDMGNIVNVVKGGSTVPLKFNIYDCNGGERTSVNDVLYQSVQVGEYTCGGSTEVPMEDVPNTGATALRYDTTGHQFIQNWKTPKAANRCYVVRMTTTSGSYIEAYFKTK